MPPLRPPPPPRARLLAFVVTAVVVAHRLVGRLPATDHVADPPGDQAPRQPSSSHPQRFGSLRQASPPPRNGPGAVVEAIAPPPARSARLAATLRHELRPRHVVAVVGAAEKA